MTSDKHLLASAGLVLGIALFGAGCLPHIQNHADQPDVPIPEYALVADDPSDYEDKKGWRIETNRLVGPMGAASFKGPSGWTTTSTRQSVMWTNNLKIHPDTEPGLCTGGDIYDRGAELSLTLEINQSSNEELQGFHCGEGGCMDDDLASSTRATGGYRAIEHRDFTDFCSGGMRGIDTHFTANGLIYTVALRTAEKDFTKYKPAYDALVASMRLEEGEPAYGDVAVMENSSAADVTLREFYSGKTVADAMARNGNCLEECFDGETYTPPIFRHEVALSVDPEAVVDLIEYGKHGMPSDSLRRLTWTDYREFLRSAERDPSLKGTPFHGLAYVDASPERPFHLFFKNGKIVRMVEQYKPYKP